MHAVRELRTALGLSQTEFGRLLGKSLPTVQRWETLRPPDGKALALLEQLATDRNHPELARPFHDALVGIPSYQTFELDTRPRDRAEAFRLFVLIQVMRDPDPASRKLVQQFEKLFAEPMARCREAVQKTEDQRMQSAWGPFFKMAAKFQRSDADIMQSMKREMSTLPLEQLKTMRRVCEGCKRVCEPGVEVCPNCHTQLGAWSLPVTEPAPAAARGKKTGRRK